ncbi:substrate-binding periplasmic protein [Aliamphritea ceti]|uniref:substrate-binding periplasmic protein n=1 Tax=Aliamphritea ceti TaxID=1524258 RepID=UPI0021C49A82|nr:transporter substrate-binding domain-containing protein [Aliamphritea ceti]
MNRKTGFTHRMSVLMLFVSSLFSSSLLAASDLKIFASHYPPFNIADNPLTPGFDVEVTEAAFAASGVNVNVDFRPWARIMRDVQSGNATAAVTCSENAERRKQLNYSDQISSSQIGLLSHTELDTSKINSLEDLRDYRVVSVNGYATQTELINKSIKTLNVNRMDEALNLIARQRQDIFYVGREAALFIANQLGLAQDIKFTPLPEKPILKLYVCFSKQWPDSLQLISLFNQGLQRIRNNGVMQEIHARYGLTPF